MKKILSFILILVSSSVSYANTPSLYYVFKTPQTRGHNYIVMEKECFKNNRGYWARDTKQTIHFCLDCSDSDEVYETTIVKIAQDKLEEIQNLFSSNCGTWKINSTNIRGPKPKKPGSSKLIKLFRKTKAGGGYQSLTQDH